MKTKRKISSLGSSPFSCPKFGEDQKKKGLHSNLVRFLAQTKSLHRDSIRLCAQTFCPSYKRGGHAALLHTILCELYYPGDPKGGAMAPCPPPPKYAPLAPAKRLYSKSLPQNSNASYKIILI